MISVCVPVYNENIDTLIKALYYQKSKLPELVEIIVIDDASDISFRKENRKLGKYIDKYVELEENVGRPRIRNLFLKYATKPYLLFIDSDSLVDNSQFLDKYIRVLKENQGAVIVGGAIYSKIKPKRDKLLKWRYGRIVESKPAKERAKFPYRSFLTKNIVIPAKVLKTVPFCESLKTYGHDDTFMGYELKRKKVKIIHIDNVVRNSDDLDSNEVFVEKSKEAVDGVFFILSKVNGAPDFIEDVKLLVWVRKLYKMKLAEIVKGVLDIFNPFIEYALKNGIPSLFLFSIFKLHHALEICAGTEAEKYFRN